MWWTTLVSPPAEMTRYRSSLTTAPVRGCGPGRPGGRVRGCGPSPSMPAPTEAGDGRGRDACGGRSCCGDRASCRRPSEAEPDQAQTDNDEQGEEGEADQLLDIGVAGPGEQAWRHGHGPD